MVGKSIGDGKYSEDETNRPYGKVYEKNPPPGGVRADGAANDGPHDGGNHQDNAKDCHDVAELLERPDFSNHDKHRGKTCSSTKSLKGSQDNAAGKVNPQHHKG